MEQLWITTIELKLSVSWVFLGSIESYLPITLISLHSSKSGVFQSEICLFSSMKPIITMPLEGFAIHLKIRSISEVDGSFSMLELSSSIDSNKSYYPSPSYAPTVI